MHLGNVRASISDRRQFSSTIFDPVISDATDYFPFGAPNRTVSSSTGYRYGFNGKELDKNNEFGTANVYDYGFRIYNPSIGRFLSVDPLSSNYHWYTPYQFAGNTPMQAIDLDGLEPANGTVEARDNMAPIPLLRAVKTIEIYQAAVLNVFQNSGNKSFRPTGVEQEVISYFNKKIVPDNLNETPELFRQRLQIYDKTIEALFSDDPAENSKAIKTIQLPQNFLYNNYVASIGDLLVPSAGLVQLAKEVRAILKLSVKILESASKPLGEQGLTVVGRALQKHAGREGSVFQSVKFSHLTANDEGMKILNEIMNAEAKIITNAENGGKLIFDKATGRGFGISREGLFNGFRELPNQ